MLVDPVLHTYGCSIIRIAFIVGRAIFTAIANERRRRRRKQRQQTTSAQLNDEAGRRRRAHGEEYDVLYASRAKTRSMTMTTAITAATTARNASTAAVAVARNTARSSRGARCRTHRNQSRALQVRWLLCLQGTEPNGRRSCVGTFLRRTRLQRPPCSFSTSSTTANPDEVNEGSTNSQQQPRRQRQRPVVVDPTAKRPNQLCDPYGQGGKPLGRVEADRLLSTIHEDWIIEQDEDDNASTISTPTTTDPSVPTAISRQFLHPDYVSGGKFAARVAAVAEMNAHYPFALSLERRIVRKSWQVVTTIRCRTLVLGGLSSHDFYLAMVRIVAVHGVSMSQCSDFLTTLLRIHSLAFWTIPSSTLIYLSEL